MRQSKLIVCTGVLAALVTLGGCAAKPVASDTPAQSAQRQSDMQKVLSDPRVPQQVKDQIRSQQQAQQAQQSQPAK